MDLCSIPISSIYVSIVFGIRKTNFWVFHFIAPYSYVQGFRGYIYFLVLKMYFFIQKAFFGGSGLFSKNILLLLAFFLFVLIAVDRWNGQKK